MIDNDFEVPPATDVPADVRTRIETKVLAGIRRTPRTRVLAFAAAAAAVVAVCGVVVATLGSNSTSMPPAGRQVEQVPALPEGFPPAMPPSQAGYEMDRCALAIQQLPNKDQYPARQTWQSLVVVGSMFSRLSAIRADGKLLFCETTVNKVTVSAPDGKAQPLPGTKGGVLLVTEFGAIAGTVDPTWSRPIVQETTTDGDTHDSPAQRLNGMFLTTLGSPPSDDTTLSVRGQDNGEKLALPRTLGAVVDNPPYPPAGRTSERDRKLSECLAKVKGGVPDANLWQAGAMAEAGGERLIMATNPAGTSACHDKGQTATFLPMLAENLPTVFEGGAVSLSVPSTLGGHRLVAGSMGNLVARMELTFPGGKPMDADVLNNSFAVLLPAGAEPDQATTTLSNSAGGVLQIGRGIDSGNKMIINH
ncbi:hypothetical protein [Actinocrispum wychmicini]|uniref:Uncharacterized protein n=1 Tax=Actinocrispum wychmicini TaxID=1213861 RepID=A0A4R2KH39_9PSEU|nr:hypothetical protein [Actinocrispum wychmicini]TCO65755.1 hypothetical protein EV192_1011547 [Actinocrispum wychmicini]